MFVFKLIFLAYAINNIFGDVPSMTPWVLSFLSHIGQRRSGVRCGWLRTLGGTKFLRRLLRTGTTGESAIVFRPVKLNLRIFRTCSLDALDVVASFLKALLHCAIFVTSTFFCSCYLVSVHCGFLLGTATRTCSCFRYFRVTRDPFDEGSVYRSLLGRQLKDILIFFYVRFFWCYFWS